MTEVLMKAKQAIKTAIEAEILKIMAEAVESAKSAMADEALSECGNVLDEETLNEAIREACRTFNFSDHI